MVFFFVMPAPVIGVEVHAGRPAQTASAMLGGRFWHLREVVGLLVVQGKVPACRSGTAC